MLSKIEEISHVKSSLKNISFDTWVFLDLDNTVMESVLDLGGDQWFSYLMRNAASDSSAELIIKLYYAVQAHIRSQAVEPEIVLMINALQAIGVPVFALTARGPSILQATVRQLSEIGIDFSKNKLRLSSDLLYDSGIICCNGQNKGHALSRFLEGCTQRPRHLIMLDDKHPHLLHVQDAAQRFDIDFSGFRYGFLDEKVSQFDITKANIQLAHIKEKLPEDAQDAIDSLQLLPESLVVADHYHHFKHGFFGSEQTMSSENEANVTRTSRSMSI